LGQMRFSDLIHKGEYRGKKEGKLEPAKRFSVKVRRVRVEENGLRGNLKTRDGEMEGRY